VVVAQGGVERKSLEPWLKDDVVFYKHQVSGVRRMAKMNSALLADDMGLGKSIQALAVVSIDVLQGHTEKIIIICPATLKKNWRREIERFTRYPTVVIPGTGSTQEKRARLIDEFEEMTGPRILIINYEQVKAWRFRLNQIRFDFAIYDEAHYLKTPTSARSKEARMIRTRRALLLTGSPMPNNVTELWALLDRINPGQWGSYKRYCKEFAVYGGFRGKAVVGVKNKDRLRSRLKDVMIRRMKDDVLDLPPTHIIPRVVGLTHRQMVMYNRAYNDMLLEIGDGQDPKAIKNAGVRFMRLLQICGTTATVAEDGWDESEKLSLAVEDAAQLIHNGHHIVVFTRWRGVQEAFVRRLDHELNGAPRTRNRKEPGDKGYIPVRVLNGDVPSDDIVRADGSISKPGRETVKQYWEDDVPGALVCMYQVAGVGLNMTKAKHLLMLDKLFVPDLNQQAIDRIRRIGAEVHDRIQIYEYFVADSVKERVHEILAIKQGTTSEILDMKTVELNMMLAVLEAEERDKAA